MSSDTISREEFIAVLQEMGKAVAAQFRKRDARLAQLEAKPNVAISAAGNLEIDGMQHFADAVKALEHTLAKPMKAEFDASGRVIGARRVEGPVEPDVLRDLEARLKALEARPQVRYCGVWRGDEHQAGDLCTDKGSLWYCWSKTTSRPGASDSWQLVAKSGRDR